MKVASAIKSKKDIAEGSAAAVLRGFFGFRSAGKGCVALRHNYGCFVTGPRAPWDGSEAKPGCRWTGRWVGITLAGLLVLLAGRWVSDGMFSSVSVTGGKISGQNVASLVIPGPADELGAVSAAEGHYPRLESAVRQDLVRSLAGETAARSLPPIWRDNLRFDWFLQIGELGRMTYLAVPDENGAVLAEGMDWLRGPVGLWVR